ncbi:MAG: ribosome-associated translation inhibitor RaiA, partial [Burkholderiales bacterium]|nr:ribosome-associated translation inhibitor RaiA [Burkholderiales bacterium]
DVSPALREYVDSKLTKLQRHFDQMTDVHCILTVEKLSHKAEATIHLTGGTIHADSVESDMYAAIDRLV